MAEGLANQALLRDENHFPPLQQAVPLGIQHVLAMFASNITPAIIVSLAAGLRLRLRRDGLHDPDGHGLRRDLQP